jgi:cell division protein FtsW
MKAATTLLVFCVGALLSLSLVMLYSAGMMTKGAHYFIMQPFWCGAGLMVCVCAAWLDYRHLKKAAWPMLILSVVLLAGLFVPGLGGATKNGATRWYDLGFCLFQPSELAKVALVITLAHYADQYQRQMQTFIGGLVLPGALAALVIGLIFIEPDRGTAILLAALTGAMLVLGGVKWRFILPPIPIMLTALAWSLWNDPMRRARLMSWWHPESFREGVGHQGWQGVMALGAGGWQGLGLGNSRQKLGFLPEHHTDFILSIIGEELGLIATLSIVVVFILFLICGMYIAANSGSTFGFLLGSGITLMIGLQAFINIGVVTGSLPNKGLPLPFVSYGGSNLLVMLGCVGILLSIARHAELSPHAESEKVHRRERLANQFS